MVQVQLPSAHWHSVLLLSTLRLVFIVLQIDRLHEYLTCESPEMQHTSWYADDVIREWYHIPCP